MDSLAVSVIGLAAGGWQNVSLVGIYPRSANNIPSWKLGICSITDNSEGDGGATTWAPPLLICPGSIINNGNAQRGIQFIYNQILVIGGVNFTAVLFTWN